MNPHDWDQLVREAIEDARAAGTELLAGLEPGSEDRETVARNLVYIVQEQAAALAAPTDWDKAKHLKNARHAAATVSAIALKYRFDAAAAIRAVADAVLQKLIQAALAAVLPAAPVQN